MTAAATSAGAAAANSAATAIANAIKASGAIVRVESDAFLEILARNEAPLVIANEYKSFFKPVYQYLTSYRGFVFCTKGPDEVVIPEWCEVVHAKQVWIPM